MTPSCIIIPQWLIGVVGLMCCLSSLYAFSVECSKPCVEWRTHLMMLELYVTVMSAFIFGVCMLPYIIPMLPCITVVV
jgi:hypothetical protein